MLLEEVLTWVHRLSCTSRLRALMVFGPWARLAVLARVCRPTDSHERRHLLGRLQTDADRARVMEGLGYVDPRGDKKKSELAALVKRLGPRWFVVRGAKGDKPTLLNPRWALSYLRGPMTQREIKKARGG